MLQVLGGADLAAEATVCAARPGMKACTHTQKTQVSRLYDLSKVMCCGERTSVVCTKCQAGSATDKQGRGSCPSCLPGFWSAGTTSEPALQCNACDAGYFNADTGSTSIAACTGCGVGEH